MKKTKLLSAVALAAVIGATSTVPAFAATTPGESSGTTTVTYTTGTSSADGADWMVAYPKKVALSDTNISATYDKAKAESLTFNIYDKLGGSDVPYKGIKSVKVKVGGLGADGTLKLTDDKVSILFGDSTNVALTPTDNTLVTLDKDNKTQTGGVVVKSADSTVTTEQTGTINFTFSQN